MVYSSAANIQAQVLGIAASRDRARDFVTPYNTGSEFAVLGIRVYGVLESEGRRTLLPDIAISNILSHLNVTITYELMQCQKVLTGPMVADANMMKENCIIVDNMVTRICTQPMMGEGICAS
ncbi:hypothetical protein KIN20_030823 [Parelaphostrongylus tenuis]|uniref:Uncharacterized protein n=1 Tax=Parelaphostrongylus tenuis TaxID=148309 RepID=A0AAD5WGR0_PARTN|nr:hypothetical protein KIN20_030823 [Parelaphostrongylus tenuis]